MSEQTTEAAATESKVTEQNEQQTKPSETVDFWKQKAREQEKRAKDNADAAKRLADLEDAQKSDAEKAADRIAKADAEVASVPSKVAEALRGHLVTLHSIEAEDADLFLTATEPELLLKQVARLLARSDEQSAETKRKNNHVPREGENPKPSATSDVREFVNDMWGRANAD